ncbi:DUF5675 family protein [Marivirga arenosa]|uniref:DUF5675 family protein n=1 Tax=Marivirga arenosa TaxID=3059076 RepID=A0AA49JA11_9BACT|nr:DUF5675 family protein [Marivirga sp. ABR2-2]WKK84071.1 DUF5675 family protein [Marivirga sp. ABR2-2]
MDFELKRTYKPSGTNGALWYDGSLICHTIELPWKENQRNISCIPEGRYLLEKRITHERGFHLMLKNVPGRSWILIHPANDAMKELQGCIGSVMKLSGTGKGIHSRKAMHKLLEAFEEVQKENELVYLTIKKQSNMNIIKRAQQPTPKFFKKLRTAGLILAAIGGAILSAPISLPAGVITAAGYLTVGASVLSAVSQVTVEQEETPPQEEMNHNSHASP